MPAVLAPSMWLWCCSNASSCLSVILLGLEGLPRRDRGTPGLRSAIPLFQCVNSITAHLAWVNRASK